VLALIVADQVYRDDVSGKAFIPGARFGIGARAFPYTHPRLAAFVALVNGRGDVSLQVRPVDVDDAREAVFVDEMTVTFPDPLTEVEVVFLLPDLVFPEPDESRLQLDADGQFLRERQIVRIQLENSDAP
jgi:hypothetical protein